MSERSPTPLAAPSRPVSRRLVWSLIVLGGAVLVMGGIDSVREAEVDWVSLCAGGAVLLNGVALGQPSSRAQGRTVLTAVSVALALAGLVTVFL